MNNLTEKQIREIIQNEMKKNYFSGNPRVDPHAHNGTDNLNINPVDLIGFTPIPTAPTEYINDFYGTYQYPFAAKQQLVQASATKAAQIIANTTIAMYPIPVIYGVDDGGAPPQAEFNGGYAPEGSLVIFCALNNNTVKNLLYVRAGGRWLGVPLTDFVN